MKPNTLRAAITDALPDFATDPDRLAMWIEKGGIRSPITESRSFEWAYVLNISLENFTGQPAILFLVINDWLRTNQPELLQPGAHKGYAHEVDVIDESTVDMHVQLHLTERIAVTRQRDGTDTLQHLDDAECLLNDNLLADDAPLLKGVTLNWGAKP
jgi:hypothetical protein